jgi:hypothetical protein
MLSVAVPGATELTFQPFAEETLGHPQCVLHNNTVANKKSEGEGYSFTQLKVFQSEGKCLRFYISFDNDKTDETRHINLPYSPEYTIH